MSKRPASVGVNHTGESSPGVASVFTRMAGTPKLWITSLLDRLNYHGPVERQVQIVQCH